jgi:hypothetical protein
VGGAGTALYSIYYYYCLVEQPCLVYKKTAAAKAVVERRHLEPYRPTFWAANAHLQILVQVIRERFASPLHTHSMEIGFAVCRRRKGRSSDEESEAEVEGGGGALGPTFFTEAD